MMILLCPICQDAMNSLLWKNLLAELKDSLTEKFGMIILKLRGLTLEANAAHMLAMLRSGLNVILMHDFGNERRG
jgi:hypothetical protein